MKQPSKPDCSWNFPHGQHGYSELSFREDYAKLALCPGWPEEAEEPLPPTRWWEDLYDPPYFGRLDSEDFHEIKTRLQIVNDWTIRCIVPPGDFYLGEIVNVYFRFIDDDWRIGRIIDILSAGNGDYELFIELFRGTHFDKMEKRCRPI